MTTQERNQLILNHIPLANKLAWQKAKKTPKRIDVDDLKSAAYMGLVDAAYKYDKNRSATFGTYASWRIKGEINDYLRQISWGKRGQEFQPLSIDVKISDNENVSIGDCLESKPELRADYSDFFEKITKGMSEVAKKVIIEYYVKDRMLKEIASEIGLCVSRTSQILKRCRNLIRSKWSEAEFNEMVA